MFLLRNDNLRQIFFKMVGIDDAIYLPSIVTVNELTNYEAVQIQNNNIDAVVTIARKEWLGTFRERLPEIFASYAQNALMTNISFPFANVCEVRERIAGFRLVFQALNDKQGYKRNACSL